MTEEMFSICGFSEKQGNRIGQVKYDRFFSQSKSSEETKSDAVKVPKEGIYLINFYSHIDSGISTLRTMKDANDFYSAYIRYQENQNKHLQRNNFNFRINGKKLKFEGHIRSSIVGTNVKADDVTNGRNIVLHLNEDDEVSEFLLVNYLLYQTSIQVDVVLDNVMPNGAGLAHSSFCVAGLASVKAEGLFDSFLYEE